MATTPSPGQKLLLDAAARGQARRDAAAAKIAPPTVTSPVSASPALQPLTGPRQINPANVPTARDVAGAAAAPVNEGAKSPTVDKSVPAGGGDGTINVRTQGGTIGYSSSEYDPVYTKDDQGNDVVTGVTRKLYSPGAVVTKAEDLSTLLKAGRITQDQYNQSATALKNGAKGVDPTGFHADRAAGVQARLDEISQPLNAKDENGRYLYTPDQQASMEASRAQERTALQAELDRINVARKTTIASSVTQDGAPVQTPAAIAASRSGTVAGLMAQGVTDSTQITDYLNKKQDGTQVGDFTPEEVQTIMGQLGGSPAPTTPALPGGASGAATVALNPPASPVAPGGSTSTPTGGPSALPAPAAPVAPAKSTTTSAALQALIQTSDPLTASYLTSAQTILQQRMAALPTQQMSDEQLADEEFTQLQGITSEMLTRANGLQTLQLSLAKNNADSDTALAKIQSDAAITKNDYDKQVNDTHMDQQRRDLALSNKKRVDALANRIAVAGGFGSMNNLAEVDRVQSEGDQAMANFNAEAALSDASFMGNASTIRSNYTTQVIGIHRNYSDNLLSIVSKYNDKTDEIANMLRGGAEKKFAAYRQARSDFRTGWNKLQDDHTALLKDAVTSSLAQADKLRAAQAAKEQQTWAHAYSYLSTFGTQDKQQLSTFETQLGLAPGSLSSAKTLAEMRMKRYTGGGTTTPATVENYVGQLRSQILRGHPEYAKDPESLDTALLESTQNNYQGSKSAGFRVAVQNYVNDNNYDASAGSGWQWLGSGAKFDPPKQYFLSYKFHPQFEQTTVQVGQDDLATLASQWAAADTSGK